jgi:hypothetical protein
VTDDDIVEDVVGDMERYFDEHCPDEVQVPDSISDDEAVRAVQHQYGQAGFECLEEQAREIVQEARSHSS